MFARVCRPSGSDRIDGNSAVRRHDLGAYTYAAKGLALVDSNIHFVTVRDLERSNREA